MTLEENLRPTIDAKAKSLGESGSFYFHDGPNVSRIIDAKPEQASALFRPARVRVGLYRQISQRYSFEISSAIRTAEPQLSTIHQKIGENESQFEQRCGEFF